MSEIEKMMQNAGIKKLLYCDICKAQEHALGLCAETKCRPFYPPFTKEKQINLTQKLWELKPNVYPNFDLLTNYSYSEMIAELANHLWQDLTPEEKQQVKGILE